MTRLEDKTGDITGVWALYYAGYHNYPSLITLKPSGAVGNSDIFKFWAISGQFLFMIDGKFTVQMVFEFWRDEFASQALQEWGFVKDRPHYFLRRCGNAHSITEFRLNMPKGEEANLSELFNSKQDFCLELSPMENVVVPVHTDLCVNRLKRDVFNVHEKTYTAPPLYFHVLNNAKIISRFVAETSDGRCLLESTYISDINTAHHPVNAYIDYNNKIEYYADVPPGETIEGKAIYIENGAGYGHWYFQSLPCLYIVDWLERKGVDLTQVKFLFHDGINNPDIKPALEAFGLFDKIDEKNIINLMTMPPVIAVEQLIWPSPMWLARKKFMPDDYIHSEFPVSPTFAKVIDKIRTNIIAKTPRADIPNKPYIFITRKSSTRRERLLNQDELLKALEPLGFYGVDMADLHFFDKVRLMYNARIVISSQGSGLGHVIFCRPGAYMLELFNSIVRHDIWSHFAAVAKLNYACMVYPTETLPDDDMHIGVDRCFYVDIPEVVANVKKIMQRVTS